MSERLTFIHAADLHLGAPFRSLHRASAAWEDRLLRALTCAYERVIDCALQRHVDFVIFAGDTFDSERPSYSDFMTFVDGLLSLKEAGIPAYLCTGNHDPFVSWRNDYAQLPDNLHMFSATGPSYFCYARKSVPVAVLAGRGYYRKAWSADDELLAGLTRAEAQRAVGKSAPFAIGVAHTGLNRDSAQAPVSPVALQRSGMDYWALGHLHKAEVIDDPADPHIAYSGNIQGTAIDEPGMRGVLAVTLEENRPNKIEFVPTASVVWQVLDVDAGGCTDLESLVQSAGRQVQAFLSGCGQTPGVVRLILHGATPLHSLLQSKEARQQLSERFNALYPDTLCDSVIDQTVGCQGQSFVAPGTFPALVDEISQQSLRSPHKLAGFLQEEFAKRGLELPADIAGEADVLQQQAEELLFDQLRDGSDDR